MATGTTTRVFLARLAGITVLDPNADQVGRVRDVVVILRTGALPPRVLGLAVEVQPRRRVFIPIGQVTSVDSDAVIVRGRINLRRFERRTGETLAIAELLDRKVTLVESGQQVTVADVAIEQTRTRDWYITRVAVRSAGGFRRRSQLQTVDWDAVTGFAQPEEDQGAANLLAAFDQLRPPDLAHMLLELSPKRRTEVVAALDDERLADVLEEMEEDDQVGILATLEGERAADVLEAMAPDDAADLLGELAPEEAERLLGLMEPDEADPVRRLLSYSDNTAGGMMTTEPVILPPGRDRRRGAGAGPRSRAVTGPRRPGLRVPPADRHPDRQVPRRRAHPAAAPRAAVIAGVRRGRPRDRPAPAGLPAAARSPPTWRRTTWSPCRWSTTRTTCSAR